MISLLSTIELIFSLLVFKNRIEYFKEEGKRPSQNKNEMRFSVICLQI
jgi:hypothetical protein